MRLIFASVLLLSFGLLVASDAHAQQTSETDIREQKLFSNGPPKLGLAFSGGGVRSSLFSIGAMAALHEKGLLQKADIVSSVSGGSYASYWLFSNEYASANVGNFGELSVGPKNLPKNICNMLLHSNFVTYPDYGRIIIGKLLGRPIGKNAVKKYKTNMLRTYGQSDIWGAERTIEAFADQAAQKKIPYHIINTSIYKTPKNRWMDGVVEITPFGQRAYKGGVADWPAEFEHTDYRNWTAISGGALWLLRQKMANLMPGYSEKEFSLLDGGKTENLGAFALVRRDTKSVIVMDAEYDRKYKYGAYDNLKSGLESVGYQLSIPSIESTKGRVSRKSVFKGTITNVATGMSSKIFYVKMALSGQVRDQLGPEAPRYDAGKSVQDKFQLIYGVRNAAHCNQIDGSEFNMHDWSVKVLSDYQTYTTKYFRKKGGRKVVKRKMLVWQSTSKDVIRLDFPQYTTADQSYHRDQAAAFIALGYLQTKSAIESI